MTESLKLSFYQLVSLFSVSELHWCAPTEGVFRLLQPGGGGGFVAKDLLGAKLNQLNVIHCGAFAKYQALGFVNLVAARDFLDRGLIVKPFSVGVRFASLLVFRPGKPLPENARQFIRVLCIRLEKDLKQLQAKLVEAS